MDQEQDRRLAELFVRGQKGEKKAYEHFLREVVVVLRPFLLKRISSQNEIEDILQETLMSIHRARHSYSQGRLLGPWLYAICENKMIDHLRKLQRRLSTQKTLEKELSYKSEKFEPSESNHTTDRIFEALQRLPKKQKGIIKLLKLDGHSVVSVASKMGMSESAVKVTAFRGYEAIRKALGGKNED